MDIIQLYHQHPISFLLDALTPQSTLASWQDHRMSNAVVFFTLAALSSIQAAVAIADAMSTLSRSPRTRQICPRAAIGGNLSHYTHGRFEDNLRLNSKRGNRNDLSSQGSQL